MSALSCWVTCGIAFQACDRCSAVLRRMLLIGLRSTAPHFVKSGSGDGRRGAAAGAAGERRACTNAWTSSTLIRPSGPVPATGRISTPSSRARRRTDGAAGGIGPSTGPASAVAAGGAAGRAPRLISTTSPRGFVRLASSDRPPPREWSAKRSSAGASVVPRSRSRPPSRRRSAVPLALVGRLPAGASAARPPAGLGPTGLPCRLRFRLRAGVRAWPRPAPCRRLAARRPAPRRPSGPPGRP